MKHIALFIGTVLLAVNTAWAHGTQTHSKHHTPVVKEQQDWGIAGETKDARRTIDLTMSDNMRFTPNHFEVKQGETVRLRVKNNGKAMHELVLGTREALAAHAELMMKHPGMEHADPWMAHVAPGKSGEIVWTFNRAGEFEFACLIAGHFQAGMKGSIRVSADPAAAQASTKPAMQDDMHGQGQMHGNMHDGMKSSYAGQQTRTIKSLSEQEMTAYAQGQGHGFAKAAELNGYPGPMHVLEQADALKLSPEQRQKSQALMTSHKDEARRLGAEVIEAERALDQAFANRSVTPESLTALTRAAGEKLTALRTEHLRTHLAQTALLTPEQIAQYQALRGYGSSTMPHHTMHHPEMKHEKH